jgi:hypothetical protein
MRIHKLSYLRSDARGWLRHPVTAGQLAEVSPEIKMAQAQIEQLTRERRSLLGGIVELTLCRPAETSAG